MKTFFSFITAIFLCQIMMAQPPQAFHYQAVARDGGSLLANQNIDIRFSILELATVKYQEVQQTQTNDYGLFHLVIGNGSVLSGDMYAIDWSSGDYKLKVEIDAGDGFKNLGTQEFQSVPFSLFAERAASADRIQGQPVNQAAPNPDEVLKWDGAEWVSKPDETDAYWQPDNDDIFFKSGMVGIKTDDPAAALHVGGGESVIFGNGVNGAGVKMMFLPNQKAFRVGQVSGVADKFWDTDSIGDYSVVMGSNSMAQGTSSISLGASNKSYGYNSVTIGRANTATGQNAIVLGYNNEASGGYSVSLGRSNVSGALYSVTLGYNNLSSGNFAFAANAYNEAQGRYSAAMGYNNRTSFGATALGRYNDDTGSANSWVSTDALFTVGNGTSSGNRKNAFVVYKDGDAGLSGVLNMISDERFKENITPINYGLEDLLKLQAVSYNWKDRQVKGNGRDIGVIAQDVQQVLPELVSEKNDHLSVNYIGLIPILIESIKDQQEIIHQLEKRIETLENQ